MGKVQTISEKAQSLIPLQWKEKDVKDRSVLLVTQASGAFFGSIERLVIDIAEWLQKNATWRCHVANISPRRLSDNQVYNMQLAQLGLSLHQCVSQSPLSVGVAQLLTRLAKQTRSLIIHAHGYKSDFYSLFAARLGHAGFVSTLHTWTEHNWRDRFYSRVDQLILRYADVCIAVSKGMKQIAVAKGVPADKITVVHNWVDAEQIQASAQRHATSRNSLGVGDTDIVILVPARLSPEKGHEHIIEAFERLVPKYPHLKALFAGTGFYGEHLAESIRQRGLESHIRLLGFRSDIHALMALADWIALPSFKEGLPLSLLEAMALRKPIIATNVSGVPEVVQPGVNGFLVPPGDWQALATVIEETITSRDLAAKFGNRGYQIVTTRFSPQSQIPKIVKVYEDVLKRRGIA
jgi:glycosyltransferase involved in cell wall biosynthesis